MTTNNKEFVIGLDSYLDASFRYMQNTNTPNPEDYNSIYKLVKATYYAFVDNSFDKEYVSQCYSALLKKNFKEVQKVAEKSMADVFDNRLSQVRITPLKRDTQKHTMEKLLTEIFYLIAVYRAKSKKKKVENFFRFVCDHLALIGLCRNGFLSLGRINEIDPTIYLTVITEFLSERYAIANYPVKDNHITLIALEAIKTLANTYMNIFKTEPDAVLNIQLLELLVRKLCSLCYWKEWTRKEGGSLALLELLAILPDIFFIKYEFEIIQSLFNALSTLPKLIMVTARRSCLDCIDKLINTCHEKPHFTLSGENTLTPSEWLIEYVRRVAKVTGISARVIEERYVKDFKKVVDLLVTGLHDERKFVRKAAKRCIKKLSELEGFSLNQLTNISSFFYFNKGILLIHLYRKWNR